MNELKQECWLRLKKGRMSALKEDQENAISGKQKDSVQKEMLAASATTERKHNRPLLFQGRRHKMTEQYLRKEVLPEALVLQEEKSKTV